MAGRNVFAAVRSYLQPGAAGRAPLINEDDDCFWPLFAKNAKNRTVFRGSGKGRSRRNLRLPVACLHEMCVGIAAYCGARIVRACSFGTFCKGLRSLFAAAEGPRSASDQLPPSMPYTSTSSGRPQAGGRGRPAAGRLPQGSAAAGRRSILSLVALVWLPERIASALPVAATARQAAVAELTATYGRGYKGRGKLRSRRDR